MTTVLGVKVFARFPLLRLLLCGVLSGCAGLASPEATAPHGTIAQGRISGLRLGDVEAFEGIPYAAAPIGDLRWRPPQPAPSWRGVRDAAHFGADCMQLAVAGDDAPPRTTPNEDCLYLNVWRPVGVTKRPVLVWIHGGGFVNGGSSAAIFSGLSFARDGLVFVSLNYRLGRFGFFAFPALTQEHPVEPKGNYGYMDQIAALRWVRDNIEALGGDPAQVTIMGESAGGASVLTLLAAPDARGLFARAIVQSGGGDDFSLNDRISEPANGTPSAEETGLAFARTLGIKGAGPATLAVLRALPARKILGELNMTTLATGSEFATYPDQMIDGRIVTAPRDEIFRKGLQARVPLLIGATDADVSFLTARSKDEAFAVFGPAAAAARKAYDPDGAAPLEQLVTEIGADEYMVEPARCAANVFAAAGNIVFEYRYSYVPEALAAESPYGAKHFSDVPFVFATQRYFKGGQVSPADAANADTMHAYWVNFAKTGDTNGPGLALWPQFSPQRDELLNFTARGAREMADPRRARLDAVAASRASSSRCDHG